MVRRIAIVSFVVLVILLLVFYAAAGLGLSPHAGPTTSGPAKAHGAELGARCGNVSVTVQPGSSAQLCPGVTVGVLPPVAKPMTLTNAVTASPVR